MKLPRQSFWHASSIFFILVIASPLQAQIAEDRTLPNPSNVTTEDNNSIITGGTQAGANLFHSFNEFSVSTNSSASFREVAPEIENVLTRVTGTSVSNIDGLIEVLQPNGNVSAANFFLLNPNGIIFGPSAALNVGGSFVASTASSLNFADRTSFSTISPSTTESLLTVSVPVGLQFGTPAAGIEVQEGSTIIQVPYGRTLGLVGGKLDIAGGGRELVALGGRIELGSVAGQVTPETASVQVSLTPVDKGWALGYEGIQNFQDIYLVQQAFLDVSGEGSGDIQIQGRQVTLANRSYIYAGTTGSQNGREVFVRASELNITDSSAIFTFTMGSGEAADVNIETDRLLLLNGGRILAHTYGEGQGGNLNVTAVESVTAVGSASEGGHSSGLLTEVINIATSATGTAGNLSLTTNKLIIQDGAQVGSGTFAAGNSGDVTVRASEIDIVGVARTPEGEPISDAGLPFPSGLFASTGENSSGNGGNLKVTTDRLSIQDGAVLQTATFGSGNAGDLTIQATQSIEVAGTVNVEGQELKSGLFANSGGLPGTDLPAIFDATGRGGNLSIQTDELIVRDGAIVAVGSVNETTAAQGAGNLQVDAQTIRLDNGEIVANTASGQGGDINLNVQDVFLRRNSAISTTAGIEGTAGDGGDISINNARFIIAAPNENNDIKANAFLGQGGRVTIDAQNIFGLTVRSLEDLQTSLGTSDPAQLDPDQLPSSDITAISQTNPQLSGEVVINTPDVDPSRGAVVLPQNLVDVSGLIAQGCAAENVANASQFVVTGRGGLPPNPGEVLSSNDVWQDWRSSSVTTNNTEEEAIAPTPRTTSTPLVEATNWATNNQGEVILIAATPTTTLNPGQNVISCQ
ncbi:S-layer family protein [Gloeocapsopsis sp. IPPAS B-1203]|uniref:beta strand repeat-containing protein n=1 Tax=Gloeocapsopsis sp. IPPAS B-1203 TaxID=2049454 RepID=UPI000C17D567|nr:S-layer family protein [Gloeocapsopsis sp. IPPAS B-1203]PIG94357.1 filamentous hemagglutinin [Gloeocapsopsis sp. IPPAS B-1203]